MLERAPRSRRRPRTLKRPGRRLERVRRTRRQGREPGTSERCWAVPRVREALAAVLGAGLRLADPCGRRRAAQNLAVAFPDGLTRRDQRRLVTAAYRTRVRAILSRDLRQPRPRASDDALIWTARLGGYGLLEGVEVLGASPGSPNPGRAPLFGLPVPFPRRPVAEALAQGRGVRLVLVLPSGPARWRTWTSPDLSLGTEGLAAEAAVGAVLGRVADVLERVLRADPTLVDWTWPWFRGRPGRDLGGPGLPLRWPPYSRLQA